MIPSMSLIATYAPTAAGGTVSITDHTETFGVTGVGYSLNNDGSVYTTLDGTSTFKEVWLVSGLNSDYQVRYTKDSGDAPTGATIGSWLDLTTTRTISYNTPVSGQSKTGVFTVEIRNKNTLAVLDTAMVSLTSTNF